GRGARAAGEPGRGGGGGGGGGGGPPRAPPDGRRMGMGFVARRISIGPRSRHISPRTRNARSTGRTVLGGDGSIATATRFWLGEADGVGSPAVGLEVAFGAFVFVGEAEAAVVEPNGGGGLVGGGGSGLIGGRGDVEVEGIGDGLVVGLVVGDGEVDGEVTGWGLGISATASCAPPTRSGGRGV